MSPRENLWASFDSGVHGMADAGAAAGIVAIINLVDGAHDPETVLSCVDLALAEIVKSRSVLAATQGLPMIENAKQGNLYPLWLLNRARHLYQLSDIDYSDLNVAGFEKQSAAKGAFHTFGLNADRVEKWVHPDGRDYAFVRGDDCAMYVVSDGRNDRRYSYCLSALCHMARNVLPLVKWGASEDDPSTPADRAALFRDTFNKIVDLSALASEFSGALRSP